MFDKTKPMYLGDIFSVTFNLIKETFTRNILIAAVFIIPAGILMANAFEAFFSTIADISTTNIQYSEHEFNPAPLTDIFAEITFYIFAIIIFVLAQLAAMIGITKAACSSMEGERISIGEAFRTIFSTTYLRGIGQYLVLMLAIGAIIFSAVGITIVFSILDITILNILGIFIILAAIVFIFYLVFRWYFALIAIVQKDSGVFESFSISSSLVKGYWWRTFGIVMLTLLIIQFAASIITTPFSFIFMWDFISQYFSLMSGGINNNTDPKFIFGMFESLGFAIGMIITISSIIQLLLTPLFNVVIYYDLRIRHDDFRDFPGDEDSSFNQELSLDPQ